MQNSNRKTRKVQDSQWLTQRCGRSVLFAEVVAIGATRKSLLPLLAQEYRARNARLAALRAGGAV